METSTTPVIFSYFEDLTDPRMERTKLHLLIDMRADGDFMKEKIFFPGCRYPWNDLIRRITGEVLNPKAFTADFQ